MFQLYTLFDPSLNFFYVSMIMVLHPTHSHVFLHIQMVVGNFPLFC
jgi:hypothetical protein